MTRASVGTLVRTIVPVLVPAKARLRATLRELDRLVEGLPDPMCEAIEKSGLLSSWRSQLETLAQGARHVVAASDVLRAVQGAYGAYRKIRGT